MRYQTDSDKERTASWLSGGGEMGRLIREHDWTQTPLGPVENWPQSLRTALGILLNSGYPMYIAWGREFIQFYNDAYRPILGQTKHPALGRTTPDTFREIWDFIGPMFKQVMAGGEATTLTDQLLPLERNGYVEECYFTFSYSAIPNEASGEGGVFVTVLETTARVLADRRGSMLRELTRKVNSRQAGEVCRNIAQTLASNPHDIPFALLYVVDEDGKHARLAGTAGGELGTESSPPVTDLLSGDETNWPLAEAAQTGRAQLVIDLARRFTQLPTGIWPEPVEQALVLPVMLPGQTQPAVLLVLAISPRKSFDAEYQAFFDQIAGQTAMMLAEAQAYEAERKRAEALAEIDRAKTAFFSNVSHEFRTPLTLMIGPLEDILGEHGLPQEAYDRLKVAHRNSQRLLKLVNTLLDFSRIEAGRVEAVYEPVDLATYTSDLASTFRSTIERAGMKLIVDCPRLPEPIYIDREMWEKIMLNLLSNAFKFTLSGEIEVKLLNGKEAVELFVRDTGVGIPAEELPRLFERFRRIKGGRGRSYEGTGIGLALVKELVHLHDGKITVESKVGRGTTFSISIPKLKRGDEKTKQGSEKPDKDHIAPYLSEFETLSETLEPAPVSSSHLTTATILLADDNADMREYVRRLLTQSGYAVEAVANGEAALEALSHSTPDLILTDVMMPQLDGFSLLEKIRHDELTRAIPVIMLSARAGEEAKVEGLAAGADDYLVKPFSAKELVARVQANLAMARLRHQASTRERELLAEAEVARAQAQSVLTSIRDAFSAFDYDWRYTYINEQGLRLTGLKRDDFTGRTLWEMFPDLLGTEFETRLRRALLNRETATFESYYPPWNRWLENRVYPSAEGLSLFTTDITERKRAEETLRESEERFAKAFNASPLSLTISSLQTGKLIEVNETFSNITGYAREEALGRTTVELGLWANLRDRAAEMNLVRQLGRVRNLEYTFKRKNGEEVIGLLSAERIELGGESCALTVIQDISERKHAEAQREKAEARNRFLVQLDDAIRPLNDPAEITLTAARILGEHLGVDRCAYADVEADEDTMNLTGNYLRDSNIKSIIGRLKFADFGAEVLQLMRENKPYVVNDVDTHVPTVGDLDAYRAAQIQAVICVPLHKSGQFVAAMAVHSVTPRFWTPEEIELVRLVAARCWESIERARVARVLRESEAYFRGLADAMPQLVWTARADGVVEYYNSRFSEYKGIISKADGTWEWQPIVHEEDLSMTNSKWQAAVQTGTVYECEHRIKLADGTFRWHLSRAMPLKNETGQVIKWFGTATDIHDLRESQQVLRENDRRKDEFLAMLAHELRNPLAPIRNAAQVLKLLGPADANLQRAREVIERQTQHLTRLVDDLLDVSRITRGKVRLQREPLDLSTIINRAVEASRPVIDARRHQLTLTVSTEPLRVEGDLTRLVQVIGNLLNNAAKYTDEEGHIWLEAKREGNEAVIRVLDDGMGLPADLLPHVFDLFSQADRSLDRSQGGLGIGLTLVRQLIEMHGGRVEARSEGLDRGSEFIVRLPLMEAHSSKASVEGIATVENGAARKSVLRVMVVEDNLDSAQMMAFIVSLDGHEVQVAHDGLEALAQASAFQPQVILCDIGLPGMNGYEVARRLRDHSDFQQTRLIALSGYGQEEARHRAKEAGFDYHLVKPVEPDALSALLNSLSQAKQTK